MFERTCPAVKTGQLIDGPIDQNRFAAFVSALGLLPATPSDPVSEKRGYRSATATPRRAVAACKSAATRRTSGRRSSRSDGNPTGTSGGVPGYALVGDSSSSSAAGGWPSSTLRAYIVCRSAA